MLTATEYYYDGCFSKSLLVEVDLDPPNDRGLDGRGGKNVLKRSRN